MSAVVLSPKQVAEMLAVSVRWVYANARVLGGSKVGGKLFFTQDGVNHALQRGDAEGEYYEEDNRKTARNKKSISQAIQSID